MCLKKSQKIAKLRRCAEDRWDLNEKDGSVFPIQVERGGPSFGFCPAKVERDDPETVSIFNLLNAILETNTWPKSGGIEEQEAFWVELVSIFGPFRRNSEFNARYKLIFESVSRAFGGSGGMSQVGNSIGRQRVR